MDKTEYCVSCGIPKNNHWMVNHLFYSNLKYKDVSGDKSKCKICGQTETNHSCMLHPFSHKPSQIEKISHNHLSEAHNSPVSYSF